MTQFDLESLDRHYFWVERPKAVIHELSDNFDKVEDVTYINDEVPSVLINGLVKMYLPNSIRQNEMETNQYAVLIDDQDGFDGADISLFDRFDHAIDKIEELLLEISSRPPVYEVGIDRGETGTETLARFNTIADADTFMYGYVMANPNAKLFVDTITFDYMSTLNK